jgi:hypothetical protein
VAALAEDHETGFPERTDRLFGAHSGDLRHGARP